MYAFGRKKTLFVSPQKFHSFRLLGAVGVSVVLFSLFAFSLLFPLLKTNPEKKVLAVHTKIEDVMHFLPTVTPIPVLPLGVSHTIFIKGPDTSDDRLVISTALPKKSYSIAIIGDSMVDTMGEALEYLGHSLKSVYPNTSFLLYNYGIGGQNVEEGLARFSSPFHFRDRAFPPLPELHPDVLIIGSFAYNPFNPYDRNKHWLLLTELVQQAKTVSPHVYVLAEIAPLLHDFGKGPGGVNWPDPEIHVGHIVEMLKNAEGVATNEQVGLIDAFARSEVNGDGTKAYVNAYDNIHPSVSGHEFMANLIAQALHF